MFSYYFTLCFLFLGQCFSPIFYLFWCTDKITHVLSVWVKEFVGPTCEHWRRMKSKKSLWSRGQVSGTIERSQPLGGCKVLSQRMGRMEPSHHQAGKNKNKYKNTYCIRSRTSILLHRFSFISGILLNWCALALEKLFFAQLACTQKQNICSLFLGAD